LLELVRARQGVYNRQAATLQSSTTRAGAADVLQVAVPDRTRLLGRLDADAGRVVEALRLGACAMAPTLLTPAIDLCWQPVVYGAGPAAHATTSAARQVRWRTAAAKARASA
jgi:hypothetical protein